MPDDIARITEALQRALDGQPATEHLAGEVTSDLHPMVAMLDRMVVELHHLRAAQQAPRRAPDDPVQNPERTFSEDISGNEEAYRILFTNNPLPMMIYDLETLAIQAVNHAAMGLYGYSREEFTRMSIRNIRPVEEIPRLLKTVRSLSSDLHSAGQWRHSKKDGTVMEVEIFSHSITYRGRPARMVLIHDISESKRLEKQLLQSQKMEAIGLLAGGVAHDFNNMLSVIIGYVELIKTRLLPDDPLIDDIAEIEAAAIRSRDTASQLLAFSRKQIISPKILHLNDQIRQIHKPIARLIGETIALVFEPAQKLCPILFDRSQIDQILINLSINARDAMPQGGRLTIATDNVHLDQAFCDTHLGARTGDYVLLKISDTGIGMDPQTVDHVFEPFFTTKQVGKGTGLGLSTVYGIVKQNNGFIYVTSRLGAGSEFSIYFPVASNCDESGEPSPETDIPKNSGKILLVEDDTMVRRMVTAMLLNLGYTVKALANPQEALKHIEQRHADVDLVLTDVIMPEMSGTDLRDRIRALQPKIKVIFMSGYSSNIIVHHGMLDNGVHFIQKPFSLKDLAAKIHAAIHDSA